MVEIGRRSGWKTVLCACVLLAIPVAAAAGQVLEVRQDGAGNFTTISAALAAALPGTTVLITDDAAYAEDLVITTSGITLSAARHRSPSVVPATVAPGSVHVSIPGFASGVVIKGLRFDGAGSQGDGLVFSGVATNCAVEDCVIVNYQGAGAHALLINNGQMTEVRRCVFGANRRGVTVIEGIGVFVYNCLVYNQAALLPALDWGLRGTTNPSWCGFVHCTVDTDQTGPGVILDVNSLVPAPPPPEIPGAPLPCTEFGRVFLGNSIVVNGAPSLVVNGANCAVQSNCLGLPPSTLGMLPANNSGNDPLFVDRAALDFSLQVVSTCRNTAADAWLAPPAAPVVLDDLEGTCRPISAGVDMGCYEETGAVCDLDWEWNDPFLILYLTSPPGLLAGQTAVGGSSFTSCPGILVPSGRLPLMLDPLLQAVRSPAFAGFYGGVDGTIDALGNHTGQIFIPSAIQPALSGNSFFTAYAVFDSLAPTNLVAHSIAIEFTFP